MNKKIKSRPQPPAFTSRKARPIETVHLCFSFKYFDPSQGQTFDDWHKDNLILPLLEKLKEYSKLSIMEAQLNRFTIYDTFPPKSDFKHPEHVPTDASWASMHIKGKECVIGHIVAHIFYIVFLDKNHRFWITEKKHT